MELLRQLNDEQQITVLMVTHEPDMAAYARRVVRFVDGLVEPPTSHSKRRSRRLQMWWNTLLLSLREIRRHLLRSFLTILGIVIGVSAVDHDGHARQRRHAGGARPDHRASAPTC